MSADWITGLPSAEQVREHAGAAGKKAGLWLCRGGWYGVCLVWLHVEGGATVADFGPPFTPGELLSGDGRWWLPIPPGKWDEMTREGDEQSG